MAQTLLFEVQGKVKLIAIVKKPHRYIRKHLLRQSRKAHRQLRKNFRWVMGTFFSNLGYPDPKLLINEHQLRPQYNRALRYLKDKLGADNIGDYFEFGVCQGTSLLLMHDELVNEKLSHIRLFGFDSFEGLPNDDEGIWKPGTFAVDYDKIVQSLGNQGIDWKRVNLIKGFYSHTLTETLAQTHGMHKASLIMIDCDLYSSAKEALNFCRPFILDESLIFFDEWNFSAGQEKCEQRAFSEFLKENPEFCAEEWGNYSYWPDDNRGKIFHVSRT